MVRFKTAIVVERIGRLVVFIERAAWLSGLIQHDFFMLSIEITNRQNSVTFDAQRLRRAAEAILRDAGIGSAALDIAVVDDPTIHQLNRQFLQHDYPTDVLSFLLESEGEAWEGEVIVSSDTARRSAAQFDWSPDEELLLYVIHGTLHLVGYDDQTSQERAAIRQQERRYLALFDLEPRQEPRGDRSTPEASEP